MAFLKAHLICMGVLLYVVAVLNAVDGQQGNAVRTTSEPHIHRHTHKIPGYTVKHIHHRHHTSSGISSESEYSDSSSSSDASDSGDSGSIPEPPPAPATSAPETPAPATLPAETPAPATPAPETPAPETPAPATPAPTSQPSQPSTQGSCSRPTPVEAFAAAVIAARIVTSDNKTLELESDGDIVAIILYRNIKDVLEHYGLCNAEIVAFSAARGPINAKKVTVLGFIKKASIAFGTTLYNAGVLSCDNDVSLALKLYRYIEKALKGRDPKKLDTQIYIMVKGIVDLYASLHLDLKDITQKTSDAYAKEYLGGDKCKPRKG